MTIDDVKRRVQEAATIASDPEGAHAAEDELWRDVLCAIAAGADDPAGLAREALKTQEIDFPRWFA